VITAARPIHRITTSINGYAAVGYGHAQNKRLCPAVSADPIAAAKKGPKLIDLAKKY
jgi:hypothetical protein